jgi:pimeloyl-ACP methyl ester carboxylesterase
MQLFRIALAALSGLLLTGPATQPAAAAASDAPQVRYKRQQVGAVGIFYREAGPQDAPVVLLLHGFPTSSHMYRDLIPRLAERHRVIAPDYPGYGSSDAPSPAGFSYTFDNIAAVMDGFLQGLGVTRFALYAQDFGGPVGFRLAAMRPDRIAGLIVQNAVAHEQGLSDALKEARPFWERRTAETERPMRAFLTLETTRHQFLAGAREPSLVSPDSWLHAQQILDRPGNDEIQLSLLHDYGSNLRRYPQWQAYFRRHRPATLVVWGRNDPFFTVAGAEAYGQDMPKTETHLLEGGHFVLEEHAPQVARLILSFLDRRVFPAKARR